MSMTAYNLVVIMWQVSFTKVLLFIATNSECPMEVYIWTFQK